MKTLQLQQERLLEAYLVEVIILPESDRKRSELTRKQEAFRIQHTQLDATVVQRIELMSVAASIEQFCAQIRAVSDNATFAQCRQLVELLIDRVVVTEHHAEIRHVTPT
jgi:hypothetical protein